MELETPENIENIFDGLLPSEDAAPQEARFPVNPKTVGSELAEPRWSVISFEQTEAAGLTYEEAARYMNNLDSRGVAGLCIVTSEAASRV